MTALAFGMSWLSSGSGWLTLLCLYNKYATILWRSGSWSQCEHGMILSFFGSEKTGGPYWMILEECIKPLGALMLMSSNKLPFGSHLLNWITRSWIAFLTVVEETGCQLGTPTPPQRGQCDSEASMESHIDFTKCRWR